MDLIKKFCALAESIEVKFTLYGKPITNAEVFSEAGLLPALAKRADQLSSLCLGYGIGTTFTEVESAILGTKVQFDEITPDVLRLFFMAHIIYDLIKSAPSKDQVALDELLYD